MSALKRNYRASVIKDQEHWTHEITKIGFIHVHNKTTSGKWTYEINTAVRLTAKREYDTKETAYRQALQSMTNIIVVALSNVQFEMDNPTP